MHGPASTSPPLARLEGGRLRAMPDTLRGHTVLERAWGLSRVLRVETDAQELALGAFLNHVVALNAGSDAALEVHLEGGGWDRHRVPRHAVSVLPAGLVHAGRSASPQDVLILEVAPSFADRLLGPEPRPALRPVLATQDAFATHVLLALAEEARSDVPLAELRAEGLVSALVAHLAGRAMRVSDPVEAPELPSPKLRRVLEYVSGNLDAPLSLRKLAELAGMELYRFARAFKQATGASPHRFVLEARIARAKDLLRDHGLSITEIALRTGFATPSHFSVTFRRVTNQTPRAWRESRPPAGTGDAA